MYERWYGSRYKEVSSDAAEIAKALRKDVKDAKKAGNLPKGLKVSVRISRYSMGQSVNVYIKRAGVKVYTDEYLRWLAKGDWNADRPETMYTEDGRALKTALKHMLNAYNHDGSDSMTDYFDVRFYGDVDYDLEEPEVPSDEAEAAPETVDPKVAAALVKMAEAEKADREAEAAMRKEAAKKDEEYRQRLVKKAAEADAALEAEAAYYRDRANGVHFHLLMAKATGTWAEMADSPVAH